MTFNSSVRERRSPAADVGIRYISTASVRSTILYKGDALLQLAGQLHCGPGGLVHEQHRTPLLGSWYITPPLLKSLARLYSTRMNT